MPPEESSSTNPDPSPERTPAVASKKGKPRRSWWWRISRSLGILFLLVAIFHRPLFHTVARLLLIKVAAKQNVTLNVKFTGTIFTNLDVRDVTAYPTGAAPSPVEKITIESVHLEYSIPHLIRGGVGEFLKSYSIKNADLRLLAFPSKDEEERKQKHSLAQDLNNLLAQPALYADRVTVENFNIRVTSPDNVTEVQGVDLTLDPEKFGRLHITRLKAPGLPEWKDLNAETSYEARNLYLRNLVIEPGKLAIDEFNFDASQRARKRGSVLLRASAFGGKLESTLEGSQLPKKGQNLQNSYNTHLKLDVADVDLESAVAYFSGKQVPLGKVAKLHLDVVGEPEHPRTWTGEMQAIVSNLGVGKFRFGSIAVGAEFDHGKVRLPDGKVQVGQSVSTFQGTGLLPESVNEFKKTEADLDVTIDVPEIREITSVFLPSGPIGGAANAKGKVSLHQQVAAANLTAQGSSVETADYSVESIGLRVNGSKNLAPTGRSPLEGLAGDADVDLKGLRYKTFTADTAKLSGAIAEELVTLRSAQVVRDENEVDLKGTYRIAIGKGAPPAPIKADFTIKVPDVSAFGIAVKDAKLTGALNGEGSLKTANNKLSGDINVIGTALGLGDFVTQRLEAKVAVADDVASIEQLKLQIKGNDQIAATGKVGVAAPNDYEGAALVLIKDLSVLEPLLREFGNAEELAGSVDFSAEGKGSLRPQKHEGQLSLAVANARYGKIDLKEVSLNALYDPQFAESTKLRLVSGTTSLEGVLEWREAKLKLRDINLQQGNQQALSGYIILPFDPYKAGNMIELDKRIAANVNAKDLDIEKLLGSLGQTSPVSGVVTANLLAGGTILTPSAHLKVAVRQLRAKSAAKFDPAEVDFTAHYSDKELTVDSVVRQKQIQPLTIKGRVPLDLDGTLQQKKFDPNLPLDLTVKLPSSSLAFIPSLAPAVRRIEGTVAIDARVSGTVEKPIFAGNASLKVASARLQNDSAPAIGGLVADLAFANDGLKVRQLRGEVGGGTFNISGGVQVPRWFEPVFDLRLRSDDVLVRRDDSVTVRVDTDVTAAGPMKAGKVAGTVWITQSRFFREIDILPIGLPGRPKPKPAPKSVDTAKTVSITAPPFRDWTVDVAIKTRPDDPFQIRGNLANGSASADLKLRGTGLEPTLEGVVRVDNFAATLPFSKLNVTRGFITFSKDEPFEPKLDILAQSDLRNYRINAYIFGSAKDPQLSLTSEPPLPQQDIISLLATGTTSSELTGSGDVLAGRAAVLVFQQLYHKIFKKRDPGENIPFRDRFNVDVGAVDERTGHQEISASMKLGENFYLIGDVDVRGEFAGRLRYLIRFR